MFLLYAVLGLLFTSLFFLWLEADAVKCPFHRYLPENPDLHVFLYLLVWVTWIVSLPFLSIAAAHIMYNEEPHRHHGEKHGSRNKK